MAAMELAIERARAHGVAVVTLRRSSHRGRLADYVERAAARGVIAEGWISGGTPLPLGRAKGTGLAHVVEVFAGMLGGAAPLWDEFAARAREHGVPVPNPIRGAFVE
jgi:LDH2 family malate/lactate/ureidoglycolate dehydrogenase